MSRWCCSVLLALTVAGAAPAIGAPSDVGSFGQARPPAAGYSVLYAFKKGTDGRSPIASLVQGIDGSLYGTTFYGGGKSGGDARCRGYGGCGIAFKVDPTGRETILHRFGSSAGGADGKNPWVGAVLMDAQANLYGTTVVGGAHDGGTVFKIDRSGRETVLYSFCSVGSTSAGCRDGYGPRGAMVRDAAGNFYGTTQLGGDIACDHPDGCGTVFKIDPHGRETVLFAFGGQNGKFPSGLIFGTSGGGALYGETDLGGHGHCGLGLTCGLIYKFDLASGKETTLFVFPGGLNGGLPIGGLVSDPAGNFYGVTADQGDPQCVCGLVFRLGPNGVEIVLHRFLGPPDGGEPNGGLVRDAMGNLFGTTLYGGISQCVSGPPGCGVAFEITARGQERVLHTFMGPDGGVPGATLIRDRSGNLYGVAGFGMNNNGVVFRLHP